ncbi:RHS repeat-associated core domain-containing protein [Streptomyces sp. NPDC054871]
MAGNRPADWHVLDLDKDPTPGDPDRVRNLAKNLHDFADDVSKVLRDIKGMAGEDAILTWAGKTAESFTAEFEDAPGKLKKLKKSYEMAGDAMASYWPELERAQALADKALVKGREAQGDLSSAQTRLTSADSWMDRAGKEADKYKDDKDSGKDVPKPDPDKVKAATRNATAAENAQTAAKSDVSAAKSNLDAAKKMAEDARKMREDAAGAAKKKLEDASDAGIQNRKWWEEVGDWVTDNWDTIVAVCKVVVAVLGVIALIVGGPILGAIVLIAALVVLADTLHKYANGEAGLLDVAFAALDCIPGMKGLTSLRGLAKGMKGLKAGLKGLKSARTALKSGAKGAHNRVKELIKGCGDPVDVATGHVFLEQADISLPGVLPFTFTRRLTSGYRCGWWFGPSWSSTIDQHLEIDEQGVVFVTEDGMLLDYPHPDGPEPALPHQGPRWPLVRLDSGGYRVTNSAEGFSYIFASPTDGLALLERICDQNNNVIDFDYDADGTPRRIRHSGGYSLGLTVTADRVSAIALAGPAGSGSDVIIKQFGFQEGDLAEVANAGEAPLKFAYDDRSRLTSWTDTNGSGYAYEYDELDRCIAEGGVAGHLALTLAYDGIDESWPDCNVTTVTTAEGAVSRFVINADCQVVAEIDPVGSVVRTAYDQNHHVLSWTDALGHTTTFVNDPEGKPLAIEGPDGGTTRYQYNSQGKATLVELPTGATWRKEYDDRGNCIADISPDGAATRYEYDQFGHIQSTIDALGAVTTLRCNLAGLPVEITDPLGNTAQRQYDSFGRISQTRDALGHATHYEWTTDGLLARISESSNEETWLYDGEGNCVRHIDANGGTTTSEYTHFDLLATRTGPDGARYTFDYDSSLRLTKVTNSQGLAWSYEYDDAGRLISETDFDDRTVTYRRDSEGRISSRTNAAGETVSYERDSSGRVVRKTAGGQLTSYTYDQLGNLIRAVGPDAELSLQRDRAGLLETETVNGRALTLDYDILGRRVGRTTPTGVKSSWSFDRAGRPVQLGMGDRSIAVTHDATGRELAYQINESLTLTRDFDDLGRQVGQSAFDRAGNRIQHRSYTYRPDGNLTRIDDQLNGTRRFSLDAAGRVTAVSAANWTEKYAYDEAGNQTAADWPASHPGNDAVGDRTYSGTRIKRAGNVRYEYDAQGRTTLRQKTRLSRKPDTWRYEWDAEDRMVSAVTPDGTLWRYLYDPLGRRIGKQRIADDGDTILEQINFTWDGTTLCEQVTTSAELSHPVVLTWDHQDARPLTQTERLLTSETSQEVIDARFFAITADLVGTPCELFDEEGELAWRARTTIWGTTAWGANSTTYTPLRFPGQYYDPETGLHYNCFRTYDPETARYLSSDPLGLEPAPNPVAYVDNPCVWADPLGLGPCRAAPGHIYRGGRYKWLKDPSTAYKRNIPGTEINHMPPDSINGMTRDRGPAIQMDKADHYQTASWGRSREAMDYRAKQQDLINQGRHREAIDMDIADVRSKFGNKYDNAIKEMIYFLPKGW